MMKNIFGSVIYKDDMSNDIPSKSTTTKMKSTTGGSSSSASSSQSDSLKKSKDHKKSKDGKKKQKSGGDNNNNNNNNNNNKKKGDENDEKKNKQKKKPSSNKYIWEWRGDKHNWIPYSNSDSNKIETAYQSGNYKKSPLIMNIHSKTYHIDFSSMVQLNTITKFKRNIQRVKANQTAAAASSSTTTTTTKSSSSPSSATVSKFKSYVVSNIESDEEDDSPGSKSKKHQISVEEKIHKVAQITKWKIIDNPNSQIEDKSASCAICCCEFIEKQDEMETVNSTSVGSLTVSDEQTSKKDSKANTEDNQNDSSALAKFQQFQQEMLQKQQKWIQMLKEQEEEKKQKENEYDHIVEICSGHYFHQRCLAECYDINGRFLKCPMCGKLYGIRRGNQPNGTMKITIHTHGTSGGVKLSGYDHCGSIVINYSFPGGTQGPEHPSPGKSYAGTTRTAYLPDNEEGRKVLRLLEIGWKRRLLFTIGTSVTTGSSNCVIWNGVHHKTSPSGGTTNYGYPDPTYFSRVSSELAAKGVILPEEGNDGISSLLAEEQGGKDKKKQ